MNNSFAEEAFKSVSKTFDSDDILGINWRVKFALKMGCTKQVAFDLALAMAGLPTTERLPLIGTHGR